MGTLQTTNSEFPTHKAGPHRRLEDKVNDVIHVQEQHSEQLQRIEDTFKTHVVTQVGLMSDIKNSLNEFITGIENTISREVNKINKR